MEDDKNTLHDKIEAINDVEHNRQIKCFSEMIRSITDHCFKSLSNPSKIREQFETYVYMDEWRFAGARRTVFAAPLLAITLVELFGGNHFNIGDQYFNIVSSPLFVDVKYFPPDAANTIFVIDLAGMNPVNSFTITIEQ